jgi:hypothetical protein
LADLEGSVEVLRGEVINRRTRVNMAAVEDMALVLSRARYAKISSFLFTQKKTTRKLQFQKRNEEHVLVKFYAKSLELMLMESCFKSVVNFKIWKSVSPLQKQTFFFLFSLSRYFYSLNKKYIKMLEA